MEPMQVKNVKNVSVQVEGKDIPPEDGQMHSGLLSRAHKNFMSSLFPLAIFQYQPSLVTARPEYFFQSNGQNVLTSALSADPLRSPSP